MRIECMFMDHIFTDADKEGIVIGLLKLGRVDKEKAHKLLFTTKEEFEKNISKASIKNMNEEKGILFIIAITVGKTA